MPDLITARSLMITDFQALAEDESVLEARRALCALQENSSQAVAVVVVDGNGDYRGLVTSRLLLKSMFALWEPQKAVRKDPVLLDRQLLDVVRARSDMQLGDALVEGLPTAAPDTRLVPLIEAACEAQLEFIPVLEDGKAIGLVPLTRLFSTVATLVLTPADEGIRSDGRTFT